MQTLWEKLEIQRKQFLEAQSVLEFEVQKYQTMLKQKDKEILEGKTEDARWEMKKQQSLKRELEESVILSQALESENAALKKEVEYLKKWEEVLVHENKKVKEMFKDELEKQSLDIE